MDRAIWRIAWSFARRFEDAEDLSQDIRLHLLESESSFAGRSDPKTWVYRVAINRALDWSRKARRWLQEPLELDVAATESDQAGILALRGALEKLGRRQRQVLLLREMEGLTYKEIAETLGISLGSVESTLFDARRKLAARLRDGRGESNENERR